MKMEGTHTKTRFDIKRQGEERPLFCLQICRHKRQRERWKRIILKKFAPKIWCSKNRIYLNENEENIFEKSFLLYVNALLWLGRIRVVGRELADKFYNLITWWSMGRTSGYHTAHVILDNDLHSADNPPWHRNGWWMGVIWTRNSRY